MYRLGWPCAAFFAEMGVPLLIKVEIIHDNEANVYVATSPDLKGLGCRSGNFRRVGKRRLGLGA